MRSNDKYQQESGVLVGVDIGGTKTAVVLCAEAPHVLWRKEFPTKPELGWEQAMDKVITLIREALIETSQKPRRIGVSCGGPLDRETGTIQSPPNLPTWDRVPVKQILESNFKVLCTVENDANAGAVAEHQFGAGRGCRHIVFLTLGTGLGAGLVLNGRIFRGANGMAGELGHVRLTEHGPNGHGKAGSVEGWASGAGIAIQGAETVRAATAAGEQTSLASGLETLSARDVGQALSAGDRVARRIVQQAGERLGEALAILVDIINPERIVIGGIAVRLGEELLEPARRRMHEEALPEAAAVCSVVPAELGEQIGDMAAIGVAMGLHDV
ncbi:ROK family protein [Terriglobus aquaticus]|uniref:ROK family protein n=1 Tax=Terriglobus aquaticus TaxID=940139 RepID=A0ABW9KI27_9BACT|nr:ROK family protein [Terriglobus aquaticus]